MIRITGLVSLFLFSGAICAISVSADEDATFNIPPAQNRATQDLPRGTVEIPGGETVEISSEAASDTLIVKGRKEDVRKVASMLARLDSSPQTVALKVTIHVEDPEHPDRRPVADSLELKVLDQEKATVQMGQQTAVVVGTQTLGPGRSAVRSETVETGSLLMASPQVSGSDVVLDLQLEKSWLEYPDAEETGDEVAQQFKRYRVYSLTLDTKLRLAVGRASEITVQVSGGEKVRQAVVTVSAEVESTTQSTRSTSASSGDRRQENSREEESAPGDRDSRDFGRSRGSRIGAGRGDSDVQSSSKRTDSERTDSGRASGGRTGAGRTGSGRNDSAEQADGEGRPGRSTISLSTAAKGIFQRLDADGNGEISVEERDGVMGRFLQRLGFGDEAEISAESIEQRLQTVQRDRRSQREAVSRDDSDD